MAMDEVMEKGLRDSGRREVALALVRAFVPTTSDESRDSLVADIVNHPARAVQSIYESAMSTQTLSFTVPQLISMLRARGVEPLDADKLKFVELQRDAAVSLLLDVQQECIRLRKLNETLSRAANVEAGQ